MMLLVIFVVVVLQQSSASTLSPSCMVPDCLQCSTSPYICLQCPPQASCCQQQCNNCVNQTTCVSCSIGYKLNMTNNLCYLSSSCQQIACIECQNNICVQCLSGFMLNSYTNLCIKCPKYCQECTLNGTCTLCESTYFMNSQNNCQSCGMRYCVECSSTSVCKQCVIGYTLINGAPLCGACPQQCYFCIVQSVCLVCRSGYYLQSNNKCKVCASECQNCFSNSTNCLYCNPSQYLNQRQECQLCTFAIPGCISCLQQSTSPLVCMVCDVGLYPDTSLNQSACSRCPQGCSQCSNSSACTFCELYYFLNNSTVLCQKCLVSQCTSCSSTYLCTHCLPGYYLISNSSNQSVSMCVPCTLHCLICSSANQCSSCLNGYTSVNGTCQQCGLNCNFCNHAPGSCTTCLQGFYLFNTLQNDKICLPCPSYCQNCYNLYTCSYCPPGSYLTQERMCQPCIVQNCFNCNSTHSNISTCSLCNPGFYLVNSPTIQCILCSQGCMLCSNVSHCQICKQGYYKTENSCKQCIEGCLLCSENGCFQCLSQFYFNQNTLSCVRCPSGCLQCEASNICTSCRSGYYLNTPSTRYESNFTQIMFNNFQICMQCPFPCSTCKSYIPSQCTSCYPQFYLSQISVNNTYTYCAPCPSGCLVCKNQNECIQCEKGYVFSLFQLNQVRQCLQCPENCLKCSIQNIKDGQSVQIVCLECPFSYIRLGSSGCFKCGASQATFGCQICISDQQCSKCYDGYLINSRNQCNLNENMSTIKWNYLGACIGLGCLLIGLILIVIYIRLKQFQSSKAFKLQMVQDSKRKTVIQL